MRVYVELAECLDVGQWRERHARGEVPDATPYGLHRIAEDAGESADPIEVQFREPPKSSRAQALSRKVRNRLNTIDPVPTLLDLRGPRDADVVLCMDERAGAPAALRPGTPVVSGINWVDPDAQARGRAARIGERALRAAVGRMAGVYTQSDALVDRMRAAGDLDPARIHLVPLGIDADFYPERAWPERPGRVFSVGDDRMRDHATLVEAMRLVRRDGVEGRLDLATTLPVDLPDDIGQVHARRLGPAVRDFYAASEVVALALEPNIHGSGMTALLEAMATGRPVVITENPGLTRYVEDGVTGITVPHEDPQAMARAIGELLSDPERARAMGAAGRRRLEDNFTSAHQARRLREVLRTALAQS